MLDNVAAHVEQNGGGVEYGWAVWHLRGAYFEAEHHGVWRDLNGQLIDVSPQVNDYSRILFLPDPAAVYEATTFRSNKLQAEPGSLAGAKIVELAGRRYRILDSYRPGGASLATLSWSDQFQIAMIEDQLRSLLAALAPL